MPARDPAASPHLPTSITQSPVQQQLPQYQDSALSSAFSTRTVSDSSALSSGIESRRESRGENLMARVLRRLSSTGGSRPSVDADSSSGTGTNASAVHDDIESLGPDKNSDWDENTFGPTTSRAIRDSTARLASMSFTKPPSFSLASASDAESSRASTSPTFSKSVSHRPIHPSHLNPLVTQEEAVDISPPKDYQISPGHSGPSGLSVMLERNRAQNPSSGETSKVGSLGSNASFNRTPIARAALPHSMPSDVDLSGQTTPLAKRSSLEDVEAGLNGNGTTLDDVIDEEDDEERNASSALRTYLAGQVEREDQAEASERTPLLDHPKRSTVFDRVGAGLAHTKLRMAKITFRDVVREGIEEPVKAIPAVILGLLLNVLDGVSYGMILFPASPIFPDFGSLGVSMFFMSCIVSQLTFSLGGSIFKGGNGSMMIEAVPFFHILVNIIQTEIGDDPAAIISTTMAAFAFSSILTGLVFMSLGMFKLGSLIGYFPRHILVGCIGGVGVFLIETGLEVSRGLKEEGFEYNWATLKLFVEDGHAIALWVLPLGLAILLRIITHFFHHQLIFPAYFFIIPVVFYIVVAIGKWDISTLRQAGWVLDVGSNTQAWWKFYMYYDFSRTNWTAFWAAMPTQLALVFFGILHVPLNVPALGVSLSEDNVKLDRELVAHGVSNMAAGFVGTVPNYLCYVNTVLFYRVGGGSRVSGLLLVVATALIMMVGPTVIGYLPVTVVGALIFVLGIDLTLEAVWDTRNRVNRLEYITIWVITIGMTVFDFVIGLLLGIILACVFFVVQSSRRRAIRTVFNGATAKSTVRRPRSQREFIQKVGSQTYVMKLQGFLFFGTISNVEDEIRKLLDLAKWQHNPIRFLIIDFALVHGLDFSSAEAFVRVQRLLAAKDVLLILCGANPDGLVGTALQAVDLWADREGTRVEVFTSLNDALEWTENAYLTAFFETQKVSETEGGPKTIDFPKIAKPPFSLAESFQNSPRRSHLAAAGDDTLPWKYGSPSIYPKVESSPKLTLAQPVQILLQTFAAYTDETEDFFFQLVPYFTKQQILSGDTLWEQSSPADGLYLIESGCLRATYAYDDHTELVQETMVAGTVAGDLSMLSDTPRNATVLAERDCVLWKMDQESLVKLQQEKPELARKFIKIALKCVAEEVDVLASHLIAVLS